MKKSENTKYKQSLKTKVYKINQGFVTQKINNKTTIFSGEDSVLYTLNETAALIFSGIKLGWDKTAEIYFNDKYDNLKLEGLKCSVPRDLRFRKEDGFYVIDRFGSEILCVKDDIARILKDYCEESVTFSPQAVGLNEIEVIKTLLRQKLLCMEQE